jgi:predicted molibdopterin-dependent oxidoreductase YjgC
VSWDEAISILVDQLQGIIDRHGAGAIGGLLSTWMTTEELYATRMFLRDVLQTPHCDYHVDPVEVREGDEAEDHLLRRTDKSPNTRGARLLEIGPGPGGLGIQQMLKAVTAGSLKALLLFEVDPWEQPTLGELAGAIDRLDLLAVWTVRQLPATSQPHLVFPALGYAEKEGTIINFAGRIQRLRKAIESKGKVLSLGEVLGQVAIGLDRSRIPVTPEEIWQRLAQEHTALGGIQYEAIESLGVPIPVDR